MTQTPVPEPKLPPKPVLTLTGMFLRLLGILAAVHIAVFLLYRATMNTFDDLISTEGSSSFSMPNLRGDVRLSRLSRVVIENPCEFYAETPCPSQNSDSEAVANLRKQQLPAATHQVIESFRYASAYDIARHLLVDGEDHEAIALLSNNVFDGGAAIDVVYKANFANKWFLLPAASYVAHHREYDALYLFKQYLDIMRVPVVNHHWRSVPGIDETDLPPIADIFCQNSDRLVYDECLLGLLRLHLQVGRQRSIGACWIGWCRGLAIIVESSL